jgi:hypothetical protein
MTDQEVEEAFKEAVQTFLRLRRLDRKWLLQELHRHDFKSYTIDSLNRLLTLGSRSRRVLLGDVYAVAVALGTTPGFLVAPPSRASVAVSPAWEPSVLEIEAWWSGQPLPMQVTEVPQVDPELKGEARKRAEAEQRAAREQRAEQLRAFYAFRPDLGAFLDKADEEGPDVEAAELSAGLTSVRRSGERELSPREARIFTRVQREIEKRQRETEEWVSANFEKMLERAKRAEEES